MTVRRVDFLLIGGGLGGATAAETLRLEGATGSILMLSAEELAPYHRPPLSKQFLLGTGTEAQLFIHQESFYRDQAIGLELNTRVIAVDPAGQFVTTDRGEQIGYGRLLVATGMTPIQLSVPGATLAASTACGARSTPRRFASPPQLRSGLSSSAPAFSAWKSPYR